ncbi:Hypothetical protein NCS54_00954100 [Fusarium falciforme]|uniref:Hypothetical protein n=1 Tax=Fusarium falciforme TaxID=195108 RepID=UPI0023004BA1|nr:Hypothetical protein NCS54_00954100 [Fusarium falciforme]WAO92049.1 Hypothetical protein NCS54_00954100 [Fusarium falciforme]
MANDCSLSSYWQFWGDCECSCPQSNPDIAGIGQVISSFITSSSLAIIATCLYLILIRSGLEPEDSFNPIDGWMRRNICDPWVRFVTKVPFIESRIDKIESTLFSFLLSLADMQLVTGIAMLSAAVIKLQDKNDGISAYHFSMVINLAWFSSMVHQLTLLAIRTKVVGSMKTQHRGVWPDRKNSSRSRRARAAIGWGGDLMVRVTSMLILASLLLYCSYVSGAKDWYTYSYCSASCALGKERGGEPLWWTGFNFCMVLFEYPRRCLLLWPALGHWWIDHARHLVLDDKGREGSPKGDALPLWRRIIVWLYYIGSSETIDAISTSCIWFGLGLYWTFDERKRFHESWRALTDIVNEDDVKGFGQLMPILLLGMPFLQGLQTYSGKSPIL